MTAVPNPELEQLLASMEADQTAAAGQPFVSLAAEYFARSRAAERPVTTAESPESIAAGLADPPEQGRPLADVVAQLGALVDRSIWLSHPRYMGHQMAGPNPAAVWAEPVIGALNQSLAIQEMSPAATAVEHRLVRWLADRIGLPAGAGGTFTSGGTEANFTALLAARAAALPQAWTEGLGSGELPVMLCGQHVHYALTRAAAQLGLGTRRALPVRSTPEFRMDVSALRQRLGELERSGTPVMAVVATAGSTATGSYDDLAGIGAICAERGLWFHVDGAHGMTAALSTRRHALVAGVEQARSVVWDAHKTMLMPLSLGLVLTRSEHELEAAFTQDAPYIFHAGSGRRWDQGPRSFQCSRRADPLKLWVALERYGSRAIGLLFDYLCDLTLALYERVQEHPRFEPLHRPDCNILCFRYLPPGVSEPAAVDELNRRLRHAYNSEGTGWITTTLLNGQRVLRVTIDESPYADGAPRPPAPRAGSHRGPPPTGLNARLRDGPRAGNLRGVRLAAARQSPSTGFRETGP